VSLVVGHHLQSVLDLAQKAIGGGEIGAGIGANPAALDQRRERRKRIGRAARMPPPAISCWVCTKNSISRMPPRPSLMLWPATAMLAKPW
jgi:hypothetical protein